MQSSTVSGRGYLGAPNDTLGGVNGTVLAKESSDNKFLYKKCYSFLQL